MLTSPIDLKERWSPYNGIAGTMESIEKAIDRPTGPLLSETERIGNYNELVVVNPIAAGFYFIYYGDLPKNKDEVITFKTVIYGGVPLFDSDLLLHFLKQAYLLHLQLYILTPDNHVRKLHDVNFSEKSFKLSPDLSPVEIVEPSWPWCLEE